MRFVIALFFLALLSDAGVAADGTLSGTATYRERIALPPDAVFEATLEDVSKVDARAEVIGRVRIEAPGNPPIRFTITYDPARVDSNHTYSVRGRILRGEQLMFATDNAYPVLTRGHGSEVSLMMRKAGGKQSPAEMTGMYRYMADAGIFMDCASRRRVPVAHEQDNAALEAAYAKMRSEPGAELLVSLQGQIAMRPKMEGNGDQPTLVVERFINAWPGETCGPQHSTAVLQNTYWKLTRLGNDPVIVGEKQREPHLILRSEDHRLSGFGGCNQLLGSYELNGDKLAFGKMAATRMACLQGADTEKTFLDALMKVQTWKIKGEHLEVFDAGGNRLARFESRYLK